jgi:hypothetical protein
VAKISAQRTVQSLCLLDRVFLVRFDHDHMRTATSFPPLSFKRSNALKDTLNSSCEELTCCWARWRTEASGTMAGSCGIPHREGAERYVRGTVASDLVRRATYKPWVFSSTYQLMARSSSRVAVLT